MLLEIAADLKFEPFRIDHLVDAHRRYQLDLDPRFPLIIKPYAFQSCVSEMSRFNWHERLELFVSVAGHGRFRVGDRLFQFSRGDIIVVDNLKLHGLADCHGPSRLGVTISFMPELVCHGGSYPSDSVYLLPFYSRPPGVEPVLRASDEFSSPVHSALGKLVQCYFLEGADSPVGHAGCKAYLLEALYHLAKHFGLTSASVPDYGGQRRRSLQFGRLYEYLHENYPESIPVSAAAAMLGMSEYRFMRYFKKATGMTFVTYLTHLRLTNAYRLLVETDRSIAEIAVSVGFADQSYFDRRFRQIYGMPPRQLRANAAPLE